MRSGPVVSDKPMREWYAEALAGALTGCWPLKWSDLPKLTKACRSAAEDRLTAEAFALALWRRDPAIAAAVLKTITEAMEKK